MYLYIVRCYAKIVALRNFNTFEKKVISFPCENKLSAYICTR
jgi:hypothetical protein